MQDGLTRDTIEAQLNTLPRERWFQRFEAVPGSGVFTPGDVTFDPAETLGMVGLQATDFRGCTVLDLGANAGALPFFMEEQGAHATAVDGLDPATTGFDIVHALRASSVKSVHCSVYDLCPTLVGEFDYVFCFATLMMVKHPLLALERINAVTNLGGTFAGTLTGADYWLPAIGDGEGASLERNYKKARVAANARARARSLNDLPISGFATVDQWSNSGVFFVPNRTAFKIWLEMSGFEVEYIEAVPMPTRTGKWEPHSRLGRAVTYLAKTFRRQRHKTDLRFRARKISEPLRELAKGAQPVAVKVEAYYQALAENEALRAELAELKSRISDLDGR